MGVRRAIPKPIPPAYRCFACGVRWRQHQGFCRVCGRARGIVKWTPRELARHRRATPLQVQPSSPSRPIRIIDGQEYVVVFP